VEAMKRVLLALATGAVFVFCSEWVFWSASNREALCVGEAVMTWGAYSILAFAFLCIVTVFRVRGIGALFLAGSVFGWLAEGVVVRTMYDDFPLNLSWTGLAWHALLTVVVGWYLVRRALLAHRPLRTLALGVLLGIGWGTWAIFWWVEKKAVTPLPFFAGYAFLSGLLLIGGHWGWDRLRGFRFRPSRTERWLVGLFLAAIFVFGVLPKRPVAVAILPPLILLVWFALRRNRVVERRADLVSWGLSGRARPVDYLCLLAIPAAAVAVYAGATRLSLRIPTGWAVYLATVFTGAFMFVASVVSLLRKRGE